MTMKDQMEMEDMDGLTVLMHATRSGNVAIFQAVTRQICPSQVRETTPCANTVRQGHPVQCGRGIYRAVEASTVRYGHLQCGRGLLYSAVGASTVR